MKLDDNFDDEYNTGGKSDSRSMYTYTIAAVSLIFLCILVMVFAMNIKKKPSSPAVSANTVYGNQGTGVVSADALEYTGSGLHVNDLDFWHDYDDEKNPAPVQTQVEVTEPEVTENELDPSTDGLHTLITYKDGTEEWLEINPYLALNDYNESNFVFVNNIMKYYENGVNVSYAGVDLSKNEDYVDFERLKSAGIDYVMIRLGQRGFVSGEITLDENFQDNYDRASAAGLDIGVYFFSQAITVEEAKEEAEFVIATLSENKINYPVVFYMEDVSGSDVRTKDLTQMARTNIAIAFMDAVEEAGYIPIICGNKEFLLKKISFGSLIGYEVWLCQEADTPDFPYEYSMWRYTEFGNIAGISGYANLNICFKDYSIY